MACGVASFASSDSTNCPSSFSETCCSIPLPNCASLPTTFRSVSTVTRVCPPASCSCAVTVAAALPVPRDSLPLPSMTARCSSRFCSTKCTLPLNSLVTGPTLTLTLPSTSSPSRPVISAPGISGMTCSRSVRTSHASSIGALTVNSFAIFIKQFLSVRAVLCERVADRSVVIGCLRQCADPGQRPFGIRGDQIRHTQRNQGSHPVDRLRHARWLVEIEISCTTHKLGSVFDESGGRTRHGTAYDLRGAGRLGVVDPVVEAPASQRVVQIPAAIGRQHRDRWALGDEGAQFRDGDRGFTEELQQ